MESCCLDSLFYYMHIIDIALNQSELEKEFGILYVHPCLHLAAWQEKRVTLLSIIYHIKDIWDKVTGSDGDTS